MIKKKQYPRSSLADALQAYQNSPKPVITQIAFQYNVPESTLRDHIKKPHLTIDSRPGPEPVLSRESEEIIIKTINTCVDFSKAVTKDYVLQLAAKLESIEARRAGRERRWTVQASDKWWRGFKMRHPLVRLRTCQDCEV